MSNFERIKQSENEHEMADIIMNFISENINNMKTEDGFTGLPLLHWLQKEHK